MSNTIELTFEQTDSIVLGELKSCVQSILKDPWSLYNDLDKSRQDMDAFLRVIEYFMNQKDYNAFVRTLDYSVFSSSGYSENDITIEEITENGDGSANVQFTASQETLKVLAAEGAKYILMKAAIGKSDNEIMSKFSLTDIYDL
jgi:hypothetical protein